jgi:hypothetical protein
MLVATIALYVYKLVMATICSENLITELKHQKTSEYLISFYNIISSVYICILYVCICTVCNMSGRVVSDIQTRAEGESLYIRYNTDANVVNSTYTYI